MKRLVTIVSLWGLAACSHHGATTAIPLNGSGVSEQSQYVGASHLLTISCPGVELRRSWPVKTSETESEQQVYTTPYGPLTLTQRAATHEEAVATFRSAAHKQSTADVGAAFEDGVTSRGGVFFIVKIDERSQLVQLTQNGVVLSATIPSGVSRKAIVSLLEMVQ